jgi:hypothetical protein
MGLYYVLLKSAIVRLALEVDSLLLLEDTATAKTGVRTKNKERNMPAKHANYWKTLLAGTLGAAAVLTPGVAYAQATGPVTSISELSDVQPTDWAFQALQSLVERYGCIAGYPDRTFRGNRAMTRYEFAAGMNACLDRINELIAAGLADKVSKEDLATLQRLQEEFAAELAALRGRVDALEADVTDLKGKVFNPVTKLNAQVIAAVVGSALTEDRVVNGRVVAEQNQANMTLPYRVRLNFDASFVGRDRLRIRLQARDAVTEFFDGDPGLEFGGGGGGTFTLAQLVYQFPALTALLPSTRASRAQGCRASFNTARSLRRPF